jgi:hypothetical protein
LILLHVLDFFFQPTYCCVAVSKKHLIADVGQMILQLAKYWKLSRLEASLWQDAINQYENSIFPFNSKIIHNPLQYWLTVPHTPDSESLKKLAIGVLKVFPQAAGVKGLFSMMSAIKTKARNQISPTTLKMMAQIKLHLLQGDPILASRKKMQQKNPTRANSEYNNMKAYNSFVTPAGLEEFKEGIFGENQNIDLTLTSRRCLYWHNL